VTSATFVVWYDDCVEAEWRNHSHTHLSTSRTSGDLHLSCKEGKIRKKQSTLTGKIKVNNRRLKPLKKTTASVRNM